MLFSKNQDVQGLYSVQTTRKYKNFRIAPQSYAIGPAGLEPPAASRNRGKATLKYDETPLNVATKWTIPKISIGGRGEN